MSRSASRPGARAHARARQFDVHIYARRLADLYQRIAPVAEIEGYRMSAVTSVAGYLKKHVLGQTLIRRNPFYYERACADLAEIETLGPRRAPRLGERAGGANARARARHRLRPLGARWREARGLAVAREGTAAPSAAGLHLRTRVARRAGHHRRHQRRAAQGAAFPAGHRFRAGQHRSGDRHVGRRSCAPCAPSVLRGDNPRDLELSPNPDSEFINGGRMLTMSANAVTHVSVEHVANNTRDVRAAIVVRLSHGAGDHLPLSARQRSHARRSRRCVTSSEVFRPEAWRLCERAARLPASLDYYGQAERIAFAYASAPREYRFSCALLIRGVHSLRRSVLPRNSPHQLYEVVGTSYWNSILPMVRYRTGDLIRLPANWGAHELEELALGLRSFEGVLGRAAGSHRLPAARAPERPGLCAARHRAT